MHIHIRAHMSYITWHYIKSHCIASHNTTFHWFTHVNKCVRVCVYIYIYHKVRRAPPGASIAALPVFCLCLSWSSAAVVAAYRLIPLPDCHVELTLPFKCFKCKQKISLPLKNRSFSKLSNCSGAWVIHSGDLAWVIFHSLHISFSSQLPLLTYERCDWSMPSTPWSRHSYQLPESTSHRCTCGMPSSAKCR